MIREWTISDYMTGCANSCKWEQLLPFGTRLCFETGDLPGIYGQLALVVGTKMSQTCSEVTVTLKLPIRYFIQPMRLSVKRKGNFP